ncbi:hypothetical protein VNI00_016997 [Paramarasmius palmivorus]|uniref:CxC2-like cysteine cluster KDZ transposase-associated domain-containing protein n=1 Tax=Paramarasmius palmivorus TaxID=297713 RepID=A0AAW0BB47_9AGAR
MELVSGLSDIVSFAQNDHQLDAVAIDFIFVHDGKEQTEGYEAHDSGFVNDINENADFVDPNVATKKAKRYEDSDVPLLTWKKQHREDYLDWVFASEGRGRHFDGKCAQCSSLDACVRCVDCLGLHMLCRKCMKDNHKFQPFHRVQEWKEDHFSSISLQSLGVRITLGHRSGIFCNCPRTCKDFTVLDVNGIHVVDIDFCGCDDVDAKSQLIEIGLWPASYKDPQSAASFNLMRTFHLINLQGHLSPTDFYRSLERMTDGTGLRKLPDRLTQFMLMVRQWRHIKMGKRIGRGHDPTGLEGTPKGSATVPCRACPQPGANLPQNWESTSPELSWLYALILSIDANFKQKARARANDSRDPALGPGWGCFVDNEEYMEEVRKQTKQDEISHCVGFSAIWKANTKKSKGLRATGIGAVTCARHELFRPNGMGDLQKGERYINMDCILLMTLIGVCVLQLFLSYDIACQWQAHFYDRMKERPKAWQFPNYRTVKFRVPKFHLAAHVEKCFAPYAFEFTEGVGEVDGEAPERTWSWFNDAAPSLSMMTAGARWDTTDDLCNSWNWGKTISLDDMLLKRLIKGISHLVVYSRAFSAFTEALQHFHSEELVVWEQMAIQWAKDPSQMCPYELPESAITLAKVKKCLADEELEREKRAKVPIEGLSLSAMVSEALEIEDNQRLIKALNAQSKQTLYQETDILKRRITLLQRIRRFRESQRKHMPDIIPFIEALPSDDEAEDVPLLLPSFFPAHARTKLCSTILIDIEDRLRYGQAFEALFRLRSQLRARTVAYQHSVKGTQSQQAYTKTNTFRAQIDARIIAIRGMYDAARKAILQLRGPGDWERILKVLRPEDIRGIGERIVREGEEEEYRQAQKSAGISGKDYEFD